MSITKIQSVALALQEKRADWKERLEALPMPKAHVRKFPYESMQAAIADGFKLFDGGPEDAFKILVKGWKTIEWRKAAEKNRNKRDDLADGKVKVAKKSKKTETVEEPIVETAQA